MRFSTISIAVAALIASIASANALPPVRAGILQCQGGEKVVLFVASVTSLECVFQSEGRRPEPYIATVRRYGLDIGFTDQTRFSWAANGPNGEGVWRRQFSCRRAAKFLRTAAAQRARPDRAERRGRRR